MCREQKRSPYPLVLIEPHEAGRRLDQVLFARLGLVPRELRRLVTQGRVRINGRTLLEGAPRQEPGSAVEILADGVEPALLPEDIPLQILYETDRLLVINKPARMVMYPGLKRPAGTVANALRGLGRPLSSCEGPLRPGIVHRLDVGTSGALLVAKDDDMHRRLVGLLGRHAFGRGYLALVHGCPDWEQMDCLAPLSSKRPGRKGMRVFAGGKKAHTCFQLIARSGKHSLIEAWPQTGRTHQIRVHLAHLGFPVVGDTIYGGGKPEAYRAAKLGMGHTALHARKLHCEALGIDVVAPLPPDLTQAITRVGTLRWRTSGTGALFRPTTAWRQRRNRT